MDGKLTERENEEQLLKIIQTCGINGKQQVIHRIYKNEVRGSKLDREGICGRGVG